MTNTNEAVRSVNEGRGRYDLISPEGERRLAIQYERGAKKFGERNWEKGHRWSRNIESARRHLNDYMAGDMSEDHLAAVAWQMFTLMHYEKYHPEFNDIPTRRVVEAVSPTIELEKEVYDATGVVKDED